VAELEGELHEHNQVIDTLRPLDAGRKCCRLISGVLVERTVGEVLPTIEQNAGNLKQLVDTLKTQLDAKNKQIAAFSAKYKIRVRGQGEPGAGAGAGAKSTGLLA